MKARGRLVLSVLCLLLCASSAAAGTLRLEIRGGLVTLEARDVPIRDILAEWARVGQTRIENREQVGGAPVTLTLRDVPEREALDILLRPVTGYIAAPRATPVADASVYEVIYVLAAARPATRPAVGSAMGQPQPLRVGSGQAPPVMVTRPNQPPEDLSDEGSLPVTLPGFAGEQVTFPGAVGGVQVPGQAPVMQAVPQGTSTPQASTGNPYASSPGLGTGQETKPVGTATPGMPTPSPPKPYVPGGGLTQPAQPPPSPVIKPPGAPDNPATTPPSPVIKPPGTPDDFS